MLFLWGTQRFADVGALQTHTAWLKPIVWTWRNICMGFTEPRFGERSVSRTSISTRVMFYSVKSKINRVSVFPCLFFFSLQAVIPSVHKTHYRIKKLIRHYLHHYHYAIKHGNKSIRGKQLQDTNYALISVYFFKSVENVCLRFQKIWKFIKNYTNMYD